MSLSKRLKSELTQLFSQRPELWGFMQYEVLDGLWFGDVYDEEARYISPEFWRMLGHEEPTDAEAPALLRDLVFPEDMELARQNLHRHATHPENPFEITLRYRHITGETVWARCNGLVVRDDDGAARLFAVHRDVTPQRGRRVSNSNRFLSLIMNATQSAIVGLSASGEVLAINAFGRHVLGGKQGPVPFAWPQDISFVDGVGMAPLEEAKNPIRRALDGSTIRGELAVMTRRSGEVRYVRVACAPVKAPYTPLKTVLILDDVTEQEKQRQQIERSARLDALGQLTGGIAHDFNNLLATIQYAAELAKDAPDIKSRYAYLGTVQSTLARGAEMTRRLLAFARHQPGIEKPEPVHALLGEFQQMAVPLIEADIDLRFAHDDDPAWVHCDGSQLENALLNLVLNSRDAIHEKATGGVIEVSVRAVSDPNADKGAQEQDLPGHTALALSQPQGFNASSTDWGANGFVEFAVTDNGPGMSKEIQCRAVDPFFSTKDASSGTGLGLSMVYGFMQQAGGEMTLHSAPGRGTSVRLLLPRVPAPYEDVPPDDDPLARQGEGQRILIVEDERHLLELMQELIASMGYEVITAPSGRDALQILKEVAPVELVLTDVVMPGGVGGFELARQLREMRPDLPVLYMSGYTGFSNTEMGDVVAPILPKPCPPGRLALELKRALQKG